MQKHDCGHHHEHDCGHHEHTRDCGHHHTEACGCDDNYAEELVENTLVLSRRQNIAAKTPKSCGAIEDMTSKNLMSAAKLLAEDGVILGHLKARIDCGEEYSMLSVTRLGQTDIARTKGWNPENLTENWTLTVNILSVINTGAVSEQTLAQFFSE